MDERYIKMVKLFIMEALSQKFWNSNKSLNKRLEKELEIPELDLRIRKLQY